MLTKKIFKLILLLSTFVISTKLLADPDIKIENAYIESTNVGEDMSVAYMSLLSHEDLTLTEITSSKIKTIEMHNTIIDKGIIKMRMMDQIKITHDQIFKFKSGENHLMLMDFKGPLKSGQKINLTFHFKNKKNQLINKSIDVTIK
ncbi:MAG: copper chaperone PCu(A)C [Candidatus Methylopumilus sp.]|nr:copper chaperone PCu(A)C [Candidatus Methylopumilus sp.]